MVVEAHSKGARNGCEQGAAGAQIDMAAIQKSVNDSVAARFGAMKPVTDADRALAGSQKMRSPDALPPQATAAAPKTKEGEAKPLTAEDVTKLVTDLVTRAQQTQQAVRPAAAAARQLHRDAAEELPGGVCQPAGQRSGEVRRRGQEDRAGLQDRRGEVRLEDPAIGGDNPAGAIRRRRRSPICRSSRPAS
jgi:hypothetical protein